MANSCENFIAGKWSPPKSDRRFERENPATGETIGSFPDSGPDDVAAAVAAAAAAPPPWGAPPPPPRRHHRLLPRPRPRRRGGRRRRRRRGLPPLARHPRAPQGRDPLPRRRDEAPPHRGALPPTHPPRGVGP